jgi:hypothetical protein
MRTERCDPDRGVDSVVAEVPALVASPMLMVRDRSGPDPDDEAGTIDDRLARRPILRAVLRRSLPRVLEASLIPNALFYAFVLLVNSWAAMIAVACWSYGAVLHRLLRRRTIPGVLLLAVATLTVRTAVSMFSGSEFFYFLQPIATTLVGAGVFMVSLVIGRPLIGRLAGDFCPMSAEVPARPAVGRLFNGLTVVWAAVYLASAAATFGLLVTLPVASFVAVKTLASILITGFGVFVTVSWSLRTARGEGLVFASLPTPPA